MAQALVLHHGTIKHNSNFNYEFLLMKIVLHSITQNIVSNKSSFFYETLQIQIYDDFLMNHPIVCTLYVYNY